MTSFAMEVIGLGTSCWSESCVLEESGWASMFPLLARTLIRSGSYLIMINAAEMNGNANGAEVAPAITARHH